MAPFFAKLALTTLAQELVAAGWVGGERPAMSRPCVNVVSPTRV